MTVLVARGMLLDRHLPLERLGYMPTIFFHRLMGAATLDADTYEEVEADRSATLQALAVVVFSSLAAGIGIRGVNGTAAALAYVCHDQRDRTPDLGRDGRSSRSKSALASCRRPTHAVDPGELLRTLGFAADAGFHSGVWRAARSEDARPGRGDRLGACRQRHRRQASARLHQHDARTGGLCAGVVACR